MMFKQDIEAERQRLWDRCLGGDWRELSRQEVVERLRMELERRRQVLQEERRQTRIHQVRVFPWD